MAKAEHTETFPVTPEVLYSVLSDYENYPAFIDGVDGVKILDCTEAGSRVQYSLNMIKKFEYVLLMKHEAPTKISWELESGDLFNFNKGNWTLKDLGGGQTEARYEIDVDFKIKVPGMILRKMVGSNLPKMMKSYHDRLKKLGKV